MGDIQPIDARLGRYVETTAGGEKVRAFVPPPLPPNPPIDILSLLPKLSIAERALGRLDGITVLLPRQDLFLYMYVRKEAVLSSQIEGTQSTLTDLLRFETEAQAGQPIDDIREVSNYVDAMMYGLERLEKLPLSLRLIREMHARLLHGGRGETKSPGEFRRSQEWIGGPPPRHRLVRPAAADGSRYLPRCPGALHARGSVAAAGNHQGRPASRPVRDHSSLPRRQRTHRPPACHPVPLRARGAPQAAPLPQPLFEDPPRRLLPAAPGGARARRLGSLARVFRRRHRGDGQSSVRCRHTHR